MKTAQKIVPLADRPTTKEESRYFRHKDICWPIARRAATSLLLYTAIEWISFLATRGRSLLWTAPDTNARRYREAQYRLRRAGWIAYRRNKGRDPVLLPAPEKSWDLLPPALRPGKRWNRRWRGTWWLLSYDVPERNRGYRRNLARLVTELGMGRLQESLFVSPDDIRPAFQDMVEAAGANNYAVLFEARTVLGQKDSEVARQAWKMDRLRERQSRFVETATPVLKGVKSNEFDATALRELRNEAFAAYVEVMSSDPLLPRALWPDGYLGERAFQLHHALQREILERLS